MYLKASSMILFYLSFSKHKKCFTNNLLLKALITSMLICRLMSSLIKSILLLFFQQCRVLQGCQVCFLYAVLAQNLQVVELTSRSEGQVFKFIEAFTKQRTQVQRGILSVVPEFIQYLFHTNFNELQGQSAQRPTKFSKIPICISLFLYNFRRFWSKVFISGMFGNI